MSWGKSDAQIEQDKTERLMNTIAWRAGYYRENPQRFVKEYLNITLKLFQKILIWAMMHYDMFLFIASRGLGKTFLVALFCTVRCILYPGTKVVCCSATYKQGREIIVKITDEFMPRSALLRTEIERVSTGQNESFVRFRHGSIMRVVTATDSSRGARSNILIVDEARLVNQRIVDTVLKPMNSSPRMPGYLNNPEYAHLQEMNKELYLSSAWYKSSELFDKTKAYVANSLDDNLKYFVCDLPYQLSIKEGLLMREQIENDMSEATFSDISFSMEREGVFYGSSENSLFNFKVLDGCRSLTKPLYKLEIYKSLGTKVPHKSKGHLRILSVDIALLASRKHDNDASALIINEAIPTKSNIYLNNIVYVETKEGLVTEELGLEIMRTFYQYDCDYLVLDANGLGQSILDYLMVDRYDPEYSELYSAIQCRNNEELNERCKVKTAKKVVYAIKANAKMNNDMCLALRAGFLNGNINLLYSDINIEELLMTQYKKFDKFTQYEKDMMKMPFVQTSFLIDELINLKHDTVNGLIKVKERYGMRKDRYSSLEYNYWISQELSLGLKPKTSSVKDFVYSLPMWRGKYAGRKI